MDRNKVLNIFIIVLAVLIIIGIILTISSNKVIDYSVKLDSNSISIRKGSTYILKATINNESNAEIKWETSDSNVATVDSNGMIRGISYGNATISAKYISKDGELFQDQCLVVVYDGDESVTINNVSIEEGDLVLGNNMTFDLKRAINISPSNGYISSMIFESSDDSVITIDGGIVFFKRVGKAVVTIKINGQYEFKINVYCIKKDNVSEIVKNPENVTINKKNIELYIGDEEKLDYTLTPSDTSEEHVSITSRNENIAFIDQEKNVIAQSIGATTVVIELLNGVEESITVNVIPTPTPTPSPTPKPTPTAIPTPTATPKATPKPSGSGDGGRTCKLSDDPADSYYNSCIKSSKNLILSQTVTSMRVGQTITIRVTLPSCGRFIKYTRISPGGGSNWSQYVSQSHSGESSTGYTWTITAKQKGSVCASQTVQFDVYSPSGKCSANIKSMKNMCFNIT